MYIYTCIVHVSVGQNALTSLLTHSLLTHSQHTFHMLTPHYPHTHTSLITPHSHSSHLTALVRGSLTWRSRKSKRHLMALGRGLPRGTANMALNRSSTYDCRMRCGGGGRERREGEEREGGRRRGRGEGEREEGVRVSFSSNKVQL